MSDNLTSNLTSSSSSSSPSSSSCVRATIEGYHMELLPIFYSFICLFGFVGNSTVIGVLCLRRNFQTVANIYIVNLAVADLLFLVTLPFWATYYAFGLNWTFGTVMCKLSSSILTLNLFASIFFITCMSIDRYMAILYPLRLQTRTWAQAVAVALSAWTLAIVATLPTFHFRNTFYLEKLDVHACVMDFPAKNYSSWCVATSVVKMTLGFCVPLAVIVTCYLKIGLHFRKSKGPVLNHSKNRVLRIVSAVVVCFVACWLPFHALTFLDVLMRMEVIKDCETERFVDAALPLAICLAFSNSCVNPLLYCFVGNQFRKNFRHVLSSFKRLQSVNSQRNSSKKGSVLRDAEGNGPSGNPPVRPDV